MKTTLTTFTLLASIILASPVSAAILSFSADTNDLYVGDQFEVRAYLNSENENINAVEGNISYPAELLSLLDVSIGDSLINFWLEKPIISASPIVFSGITPGGFSEKTGYLFSMIFETKKGGSGSVSFSETKALENNGRGTEVKSSATALPINVASLARPNSPRVYLPTADNAPPEPFQPQIGRDPNIFKNKYFLAFDAQDKVSGIDHYEIMEKRYYRFIAFTYQTGRWKIAESPYLLRDQSLKSEIQIKATDKAGNERMVLIATAHQARWYTNILFWCIS
ncbi:MAG: cohesin domain-containing protein [bacterium]